MTAVEHIIAWIESSHPHYVRLLQLERDRKEKQYFNASLAQDALDLVKSAYSEATGGGDMFAKDHTPGTLLAAAQALLEWEQEA